MTSQPVVMNDEVAHFYVGDGSLEEHNKDNEEPTEEENIIEAHVLANPQPLPRNTPTIFDS